jgi:hypothetical protein
VSAAVSYVLPLRWSSPGPVGELATYLRDLGPEEAIVVDGSEPELFRRHAEVLGRVASHVAPDPDLGFLMGKVNGVISGVRRASHERVVIADDDVRYTPEGLRRAARLLDHADLVRPQNYFDPLPWHARWDTARTLLNRVFSGDPRCPAADFPGTLAVRRTAFLGAGAYDGDVMFENLELIRTIRAAGGSELAPLDLYVARRPPNTAHFLSQRVRQAYDDFALPPRMAFFLALGPCLALAGRRRPGAWLAAACGSVAVAEAGRRRAGGARFFPASASLMAPLWLAERAMCAWLALGRRLGGGVPYAGTRIPRAATPMRELRRRYDSAGPAEGRSASRPPAARKPICL